MTSLFATKDRMPIPKNLNECRMTDGVSRELWILAELVEKWGKVILTLTILSGLIVSILLASVISSFSGNFMDNSDLIGVLVFVVSLVYHAILAFIEYLAYHLISLSVCANASIVQNTRITANMALYNAADENANDSEQKAQTKPSAPIFSDKPTNSYNRVNEQSSVPEGMWRCPHCRTHNKIEYGQCKKCGVFRSK